MSRPSLRSSNIGFSGFTPKAEHLLEYMLEYKEDISLVNTNPTPNLYLLAGFTVE